MTDQKDAPKLKVVDGRKPPVEGVKFKARGEAAEIYIYGDIGYEVTASGFASELQRMGKVSKIDLRINSFGGDVFDGLAIYSRLVDTGADVTVHVDGMAASAASVIAMAGKTIRMSQAGTLMIHNAWAVTAGNASELRVMADRLDAVSEQMAGIYTRRSGQDMDQIRQWMDVETEFNADEAIAAGLATEAFAGERMAAKFDPERHHFKRTPSALLSPERAEMERLVTRMEMRRA